MTNFRGLEIMALAVVSIVGVGCKKKVAAAAPPPPAGAATHCPGSAAPTGGAAAANRYPDARPRAGESTAAGSECGNARAHRYAAGADRRRLFRLQQVLLASRCDPGAKGGFERTARHSEGLPGLQADGGRPLRRTRV